MARILILLLLLWPGVVLAHGVRLSITADGAAVSGEARFADGSPMAEAVVELRRTQSVEQALPLARSRTDADGRFAFPTPRTSGEFSISVDDGIGHRGEATLTLSTDPLTRSTTGAAKTTWPWREWLSGLGYLLGLFGITAWWFARRRTAPSRT